MTTDAVDEPVEEAPAPVERRCACGAEARVWVDGQRFCLDCGIVEVGK